MLRTFQMTLVCIERLCLYELVSSLSSLSDGVILSLVWIHHVDNKSEDNDKLA